MGPPGEMKLPGGPMIVIVSISCSTAKTAAMIPSQRGNWPALAANRIGTASMILVIVSIGPHMLTTSVIVRAVAEPSWAGCSATPAVNHVAMVTCDQYRRRTDGEHVAGWPRQPLTGVPE